MKVVIVNGVCAFGGPERLIEDWTARFDDEQFQVEYVYTPFPGMEGHLDRMEQRVVLNHALPEWVPIFFPRNVLGTSSSFSGEKPKEDAWLSVKRSLKRLLPSGVNRLAWYVRSVYRCADQLVALYRHHPVSLFHFNVAVNSWLSAGLLAGRQLGVPVLVHIHNPPVFYIPTTWDRSLLRSVAGFVFVSKKTQQQWEHLLPKSVPRHVVHNAIDVSHFNFVDRTDRVYDRERPVVFGMCTRLSPMKAVDVAIRAVGSLVATGDVFCELHIAGEGPEAEALQHLVEELGIAPYVRFLDRVDDVRPVLATFDVYVQTSRSTEGLPMSLLESMANGLPAIATDVGGTLEAVLDDVTALCVPREDPKALAEAMRFFIEQPEKIVSMGQASRDHVVEHFNMPGMVAHLESLYATYGS